MAMIDVVALGELLIDFTPAGVSEQGACLLARNAGGAPANVLAMLSILGKKTALIGKVGKDGFGTFLKETLEKNGIDVSGLIISENEPTTLAFVQLNERGERSFDFYRRNSADVMLREDEVSERLLQECRLFHFGSVSMTEEPARSATLHAAERAKKLGKMISYDPNFRPALWKSRTEAVKVMRSGLSFADVVKVSDDEAELLTGEKDFLKGAKLLVDGGVKLALVTAGEQGTWYASISGYTGHVPSAAVQVADTTGAGDTFFGALLGQLLDCDRPLEEIPETRLYEMIRFANVAGALCTTGRGAIASMPSREQIEEWLDVKRNI